MRILNIKQGDVPIDIARQIVSKYIYEKKGVKVVIPNPRTVRDYELFERMCTYAFNYYGV